MTAPALSSRRLRNWLLSYHSYSIWHDRMPVILQQRDHEAWLDPKNEDTEALQKLLAPARLMRCAPTRQRASEPFAERGAALIEPCRGISQQQIVET